MMGLVRQLVLLVVTLTASILYIISSGIKHAWRSVWPSRWQEQRLERRMNAAESYQEWEQTALEVDEMQGKSLWKLDPEAPKYYDAKGIQQRLRRLKRARAKGDIDELLHNLPELLTRNLCGLGNLGLYRHCTVGTKKLIEDYVEEVVCCIREITYGSHLSPTQKMEFLDRSVQAYGRSALLFSGGLSFGMYHWGVIKCLFEENLLPPVICGSSIGALFAALLGIHSDAQLSVMFDDPSAVDLSAFERLGPKGWKRKLVRLFTQDVLMDVAKVEEFCRTNLGDYTFDEAYRKTGRIINIVLTHTTHTGYPSLLNYRTAPNVLLWAAASASCAQPGLYAPVPLYAKDVDGSIVILHGEHVGESWSSRTVHHPQLPMQQLRENFNVNHLIVSQVNPHVIPFLRSLHSSSRVHALHQAAILVGTEIVHYVRQFLQFGYLVKSFAWLRSDLLQPVEGNITITPRLTLISLRKVVSNPNRSDLLYFRQEGERSVYPYLAIIRMRCRIEMALNDCLKQVQDTVHAAQQHNFWDAPVESTTPRALRSPLVVAPTTQEHIPPRRREAPPRSPSAAPSPRRKRRSNTIATPGSSDTSRLAAQRAVARGAEDASGDDEYEDSLRVPMSAVAERLLQTSFPFNSRATGLSSSTPASSGNKAKHASPSSTTTSPPAAVLSAQRAAGRRRLLASHHGPRSAPSSVTHLTRHRAGTRRLGKGQAVRGSTAEEAVSSTSHRHGSTAPEWERYGSGDTPHLSDDDVTEYSLDTQLSLD